MVAWLRFLLLPFLTAVAMVWRFLPFLTFVAMVNPTDRTQCDLIKKSQQTHNYVELHPDDLRWPDMSANVLADAISCNTNVDVFTFYAEGEFNPSDVLTVLDGLKQQGRLRFLEFKLFNCCITEDIMTAICSVMDSSPGLSMLIFDRSCVKKEALNILSLRLAKSAVTSLGLHDIELQSIDHILIILKQDVLHDFDLSYNEIDDNMAVRIAKAIPCDSKLEGLSLSFNRIGDRGAKALAKTMTKMPELCNLYLYMNKVGPNGNRALEKAVKDHPNESIGVNTWANRGGGYVFTKGEARKHRE